MARKRIRVTRPGRARKEAPSLQVFMNGVIEQLKSNGKQRTSESYRSALNSFNQFAGNRTVSLSEIDAPMMERYESYLSERGVVRNTISFYMRILRAVYNRGVDRNLVADLRPFRHVYTGVDHTVKRGLTLQKLQLLLELDLSADQLLEYARDMFMLSFYLRGMSFVDMAFLRKSDLSEGHLVYRRRKTNRLLSIQWTPEMQSFIEKYPPKIGPYLLPILGHRAGSPEATKPIGLTVA